MFGFLLLLSILVVAILVVGVYNSLIRLRNRVENAWAQIEVQLKRRNDLIPNLVETVKGYAKHEKGLFENVTKARSAVMSAGGVSEKAEASNFLSSTLKSLFAVVENYPELKANQNFIGLQNELSKTEDKITYARQFYNDITTRYNIRIQTVPSNIVAVLFKFNKKDLFEAPESERSVPKVEF
ncbi:lemA family protein [archaeon BMS3Abin16]|nr:lemA family protein [archaeon BMS3Abin16]HDY74860.1 LemA family protein [Euryarchaeota archaeon]